MSTLTGLPDLKEALKGIPGKLKVKALREALAAGARLVQRAARTRTPTLKLTTRAGQYAYRKGYRKPGTVAKAISVRTSKVARREGNVGVFVNVRPVKGSAKGAKNHRDPFYHRFIQWGWNPSHGKGKAARNANRKLNVRGAAKSKPGAHFLEEGVKQLGAAFEEFKRRILPAIAKLNKPKAPAP